MSAIIYLNGSLIPKNEARISALDYGFLYGYGLFETMRAYNGRVFRLNRHIERLTGSCQKIGIPVEGIDFEKAMNATITANKLYDARIRVTVSIGEGTPVPDPATCTNPTVMVIALPYNPLSEEVYEKGYSAITSTIGRNRLSPSTTLKSSSYLDSILAREEARKARVDEVLCFNEKGFLAEAGMSNIFLVANGILKTPSIDSGILPGITRETVLELAALSGIKVQEQEIDPKELINAQEAFLTNSIIEIVPLTLLDGKAIGTGKPGAMTRQIMNAYRELVAAETG